MGLEAYPQKKGVESRSFNIAGWRLISAVHRRAETGIYDAYPDTQLPASVRIKAQYEMDAAEAKATAKAIQELGEEEILVALEDEHSLWAGTDAEFLDWVYDWVDFLEQCGGYRAE